jgi:hypothetical protein
MTLHDHNPDTHLLPPEVAQAAGGWRPDYQADDDDDGTTTEMVARWLAGVLATPDVVGYLEAAGWGADDIADLLAKETKPAAIEASATERANLPGGRLRQRLITGADILNIPDPPWLVDGVIPSHNVTTLVGPPGCGKTFLALDLAMATLTGRDWGGRKTTTDPARSVLWLAGEGATEVGKRARAWCAHHGVDVGSVIGRLHLLHGGLALHHRDEADDLIAMVADLDPQLIVIDTLARHSVGGDENSAKDMGLLFDALERLARLEAAVVVVHHTGKDASRGARGNSSINGAVRSEITTTKAADQMYVRHTKANNGAEVDGWYVTLTPAGEGPKGGHLSMVAVTTSGPTKAKPADVGLLVSLVAELDLGDGVTHTSLKDAAMAADGLAWTDATLRSRLKAAIGDGQITKGEGHRGRYRVADLEADYEAPSLL